MKNRLYFLSFFAALFHISLFAQTPCTYSTNLPAAMPDGFSGSFQITVSGATNPSLGVNGQRVCGVHLQFQHEYMGDLVVRLINPLGQSVTLVGPHVFAGGTDFTTWDVHFIPCVELANPDPGFTPQWNNNQTWGMDHSYAGTYHPFEGCFEDMTGPVNGTWTLMITDGQAIDQGELFFWGIDFCDPTGLTCTDCAANAGQLSQGDMTVCAGGPPLNLPPTYFIPGLTPPDDEYDYTSVISRKSDGVILGYDANANLGSMNPGNYTVCGFSYRTDAAALLPAPDGSLTTAQLKAQLASSMPPFCGNVSDNCVNITLQPETTDSLLTASICAPGCVTFYNDTYCTSGTYVKNIGPVGCQYTATLVLNIIPAPPVVLLQDTICAGSCSTMPGFENACTSGLYERATSIGGVESRWRYRSAVYHIVLYRR